MPKRLKCRHGAALKIPRRADTDERAHEQCEVTTASRNQQPLENIDVQCLEERELFP